MVATPTARRKVKIGLNLAISICLEGLERCMGEDRVRVPVRGGGDICTFPVLNSPLWRPRERKDKEKMKQGKG